MCKDCGGNSEAASEVSKYSWGVDGKGRAHICKNGDNLVILCMISGTGIEGVWILEEQEQHEQPVQPAPATTRHDQRNHGQVAWCNNKTNNEMALRREQSPEKRVALH